MTQQYIRKFSLIVANADGEGLDLSELRVVFNVRRGDFQTPNSCDVRIYNLSIATAQLIYFEFTQIRIQAGYGSGVDFDTIFQGTIMQARIGRENQLDNYIDITAADGDALYNYSISCISLAAGSTAKNSVLGFLQSMATAAAVSQGVFGKAGATTDNLTSFLGYVPPLHDNGRLRGQVFFGMTREELREFARDNHCSWSIQDGKLTLIPLAGYIPSITVEVPILSSGTGLIGVPEQTQAGINMAMLLNPTIKIGSVVKLDNSVVNQLRYGIGFESQNLNPTLKKEIKLSADSLYYVMVANHNGDTRGNEWYTTITCLAVDASITQDRNAQASIQPVGAPMPVD